MRMAVMMTMMLVSMAAAQHDAGQPTGPADGAPAESTAATPESGGAAEKTEAEPPQVAPPTGRPNPFAPSEAIQAQTAAARPAPAVAAQSAAPLRPVLEGVIVKGEAVLACLRVGSASVVVEPGDILGEGGADYEFVSYAEGLATLRDGDGTLLKVRMSVRPASVPAAARPPVIPVD